MEHPERVRDWALARGGRTDGLDVKTVHVASLLRKSLRLLNEISNEEVWWGQGEYTHPEIRGVVRNIEWPKYQTLTLAWARSFSIEDLAALRQMAAYARDPEVAAVVFNFMIAHIKPIVLRHQNLLGTLDPGQNAPGAVDLIPIVTAATDHSIDLRAIAPPPSITPAAPAIPPTATIAFDATEIDTFLATAPEHTVEPLETFDFQDTWRRHHRATQLITALLDQVGTHQTPRPDWAAWHRSSQADSRWTFAFARYLAELWDHADDDARRVDAASRALSDLRASLEAEHDFVNQLDKSDAALALMTPHQQDVMNAAVSLMNALVDLTRSSADALNARRTATRKVMETISNLTVLSGCISRDKISGAGQSPAEGQLRQTLEALAHAPD